MVNETNRNAHQKIALGLTEHSRLKSWTDTYVNEMKLFIGILLWMGLVKLPKICVTGVVINFTEMESPALL